MSHCTNASYEPADGLFAVATVARDPADSSARALANHQLLRFHALGTRRGAVGVPKELTRLNPKIMGLATVGSYVLPAYRAEAFRFSLHPWFDHWARSLVQPGDHLISSFGFTNNTFRHVRACGGKTFYSAGNSHPAAFWAILEEEHKRWNSRYPPIPHFQHRRVMEMMPLVDYVLSPSSFVTRSYTAHGFRNEQILKTIYPVDLDHFRPSAEPRSKNRPLTIISTGQLSLRKGTPYLFEAFMRVRRHHPSARLLLTRSIHSNVKGVLAKYADLPIDWAPALPHPQLAERLRSADIFLLPSLEEGLVRTALEAMACGLPVVVTPNTGANDMVEPGENGEIVPIRDPAATADAILKWADKILTQGEAGKPKFDRNIVSFDRFEHEFLLQLAERGLISRREAQASERRCAPAVNLKSKA